MFSCLGGREVTLHTAVQGPEMLERPSILAVIYKSDKIMLVR